MESGSLIGAVIIVAAVSCVGGIEPHFNHVNLLPTQPLARMALDRGALGDHTGLRLLIFGGEEPEDQRTAARFVARNRSSWRGGEPGGDRSVHKSSGGRGGSFNSIRSVDEDDLWFDAHLLNGREHQQFGDTFYDYDNCGDSNGVEGDDDVEGVGQRELGNHNLNLGSDS